MPFRSGTKSESMSALQQPASVVANLNILGVSYFLASV